MNDHSNRTKMEDIVKTAITAIVSVVSVFCSGFFGAIALFIGLGATIIILLLVLAMLLVTVAGAVLISPFVLIYFLVQLAIKKKTPEGPFLTP